MTLKHTLLTLFAGGHLLLVVCGATGTKLLPTGSAADELLQVYATASGADTGYGFFAPGVAPQYRVRFELTDADGRRSFDALEANNAEARLRFSGIASLLAMVDDVEGERIVRSLAGTMFGRHPEVKRITVQIEMFGTVGPDGVADFPTMRQFRDGANPRWLLLHTRTYERDDATTNET